MNRNIPLTDGTEKGVDLEGKDYDIDEIIWMWDVTTRADKTIIENNQKGVLSSKYTPGPLSLMEIGGVDKFQNWYLKHLQNSL